MIHRLEGEALATLAQHFLNFGERRAGPGGKDKLSRLIKRDAGECTVAISPAVTGRPRPLGVAAAMASGDGRRKVGSAARPPSLPGVSGAVIAASPPDTGRQEASGASAAPM
jgi:hypothetical protein